MHPITADDLLRYHEGDIDDADELARIASALETDPDLARQYEELQDALEPSDEVRQYLSGMFAALDASYWYRFVPPRADHACATAQLTLPSGQQIDVQVRCTGDGVEVNSRPRPFGWRLAGLTLFTPRPTRGRRFELRHADLPLAIPTRREPPAAKAREDASVLVAHGGSETTVPQPTPWGRHELRNDQGAAATLFETSEGVVLELAVPAADAPLAAVNVVIRWLEPQTRVVRDLSKRIKLARRADGERSGQWPLGVGRSDFGDSPVWGVYVDPVPLADIAELNADQIRAVAGDDCQTLVLAPAPEPDDSLWARFLSDQQRERWADPHAVCCIRVEPDLPPRHPTGKPHPTKREVRENDADETGCSRVYQDWMLLDRIDRDLAALAIAFQLVLDMPPNVTARARAKQADAVVSTLAEKLRPFPVAWADLRERMFLDQWIAGFVGGRRACGVLNAEEREQIVDTMLPLLLWIVIRNAGKWFVAPNRKRDWKGWVICQVDEKVRREVVKLLKVIAAEAKPLRALDRTERLVVFLRHWRDMSLREIARLLKLKDEQQAEEIYRGVLDNLRNLGVASDLTA